MIVGDPRVTVGADEVTVAAEVTVERAIRPSDDGRTYPPELYFAFPRALAPFVGDRADAFAAALLPLAMRRGERLRLRGDLSCRLAHGLRDYQRIQATWKPDFFTTVPLECDGITCRAPDEGSGAVGSAFSGGVDSFHTLWTHLAANEAYAPYAITHCLMINGFDEDTDLGETGRFRALRQVYEPMLAELGLTLLVVRTNLRRFIDPWILEQAFSASVAASALALGDLFSRFYLPSSGVFAVYADARDGGHPMLDHLLSTETMETVHDGGHLTRIEKTVALSRWPVTFHRLRVCFRPTDARPEAGTVVNCCACEKCLRTMAALEVAGALSRYTCFPQPLTRRRIRSTDCRRPAARFFAGETRRYARSVGRRDVARDMRLAVLLSITVRPWLARLAAFSHALQSRSRTYAAAVRLPKAFIRRLGWGRGWLY